MTWNIVNNTFIFSRMSYYVCFKISLSSIWLGAFITSKRLLSLWHSMFCNFLKTNKHESINEKVPSKLDFSRMSTYMPLQKYRLNKVLRTLLSTKWFLSRMWLHVPLEMSSFRKLFWTLGKCLWTLVSELSIISFLSSPDLEICSISSIILAA